MKNKGDALAHEKQQMACNSPGENVRQTNIN